jgi:hypothetical protein
MMKVISKILLILFAAGFTTLNAQDNTSPIFRIEDGNMILTLDLKWNAAKRAEVARNYDIDSLAMEQAYRGASQVTSQKSIWTVRKINSGQIELSKPLDSSPSKHISKNDIFIVNDSWLNIQDGTPPAYARSGINKIYKINTFTYKNGIATFFLPSYKWAGSVYLSGTFNNWSTTQTPMHKTDSGWVAKIRLLPGKYSYKYIADGRWHEDPNNYIRERDVRGGFNSIIFCTNYEFHLKGRLNAHKVVLSGSFNNWSTDDYRMIKTYDGWVMPIYLSEGTYAYKFIVDGQWITDPENKDIRYDADGNKNSFMGIGESYVFRLKGYLNAGRVILSGTFNNWSENELVMNKTTTGWELPYILAPGSYEYKFIVDGNWMTDPENPLINYSGSEINSVLTFKPNYTFTLNRFLNATEVSVSGDFNGWSEKGYRMYKKNGKWVLPVFLSPGKHLYKFIVDGTWYTDPDNKLWEENEYGTGNSVLWIGQ